MSGTELGFLKEIDMRRVARDEIVKKVSATETHRRINVKGHKLTLH